MLFCFKGKNGQVVIERNGIIRIGRKGWFGILYQFITRGSTEFPASQVEEVILKEPGLMRGYLAFRTPQGRSTVWLTNTQMAENARRAKSIVDSFRSRTPAMEGQNGADSDLSMKGVLK